MTKLDEIAPCFQLSVVYRMFLVPKTLWLDLWGHFKNTLILTDFTYIQSAKIAKVPALQKLTNIRSMKCSNGFSMHFLNYDFRLLTYVHFNQLKQSLFKLIIFSPPVAVP